MMNQNVRLLLQMLAKGVLGFGLLGALLLGCAGTLGYARAWVFLATLAALMAGLGLVLYFKAPQTLARRLKSREAQRAQKGTIGAIGLLFLLSFALAGLDHRWGWSRVPLWASAAAWVLMVGGYVLYAAVMLQNAYAARVVEVQENQILISTGLYALVRHPLYLASLLVFLPMPLLLGSWAALAPLLPYPFLIALRIQNEEKVLAAGLPGYTDYMQKTKYRLIPRLW